MHGHGQYERLGGTLDDAAGEAFDKIGRVLGLPYPGGPNIERAAQQGNPAAYKFPRVMRDTSYDFSFSGLKTAVMRQATMTPNTRQRRGADKKAQLRNGISVNDIAASFQAALVDSLVEKTARAAKAYNVNEVFLAGGVSANQYLRQAMRRETELPVRYPPLNLCTDNGVMIAAAGYFRYVAGLRDDLDIEAILIIFPPCYHTQISSLPLTLLTFYT
jgi:N6-L-threonylcarbamoyladenine synthase